MFYISLLLWLRNSVQAGVASCISVLRILLMSKIVPNIAPDTKQGEAVILGNGPSLRQTLDKHLPYLSQTTNFAVNGMVLSPHYESLQPAYYLLVAPEFYLPQTTVFHQEVRQKIFQNIADRTHWKMTVVMNAMGKNSPVVKDLFAQHPHVQLRFMNLTPIEGYSWLRFWAYRNNIGSVRPHNVLLPSILLALNLGYKKISLVGADHSWHEEVRIDPQNNTMTVNHEHFYDARQQTGVMYQLSGATYYIHDFFRKIYLAFSGYHELKQYATAQKASITNCSEKSYIDAFERGTLGA